MLKPPQNDPLLPGEEDSRAMLTGFTSENHRIIFKRNQFVLDPLARNFLSFRRPGAVGCPFG